MPADKSGNISLATPHMSEEGYELEYINRAFADNYIAPLGRNVDELEAKLCEYLDTRNIVALSSGTAALHLAMILAGADRGDHVFCQSITFSASANPIKYVGANPVFVDSEYGSWNISPEALRAAVKKYGVPKAVVAVDLYGMPADYDGIESVCEEYGMVLIEDAAEALGSTYKGRHCGTFGQWGVLSFNGNKIITTSGGGALICPSAEAAAHAKKLATQAREPFPWYEHKEVGYNYRLSNICAGIGCGQMKVLDRRVARKREIFRLYTKLLDGLPLTFQKDSADTMSNHWLTSCLIDRGAGTTPSQLIGRLKAAGIEARHAWKPMHMQEVFSDAGYVTAGGESVCEDIFARGVCLPSDTKLTDDDISRVCEVIRSCF